MCVKRINKDRIDIMVDIKTLGASQDATIFQIAAIAFDIKTGEHLDEFNVCADITQNEKINVDGATLKWWLKTNKDLFSDLLHKGEKSSANMLYNFYIWLTWLNEDKKKLYLWGNGILFDNRILKHQMEALKLGYPVFYRNDRDVRTIVDLACAKLGITEKELKEKFNDSNLIEHSDLDDVKRQVKLVTYCYKILTNN